MRQAIERRHATNVDIAVIGASGDVGRAITTRLVAGGLLERHERLQLVGRRGRGSERVLEGYTVDLLDAYAERAPVIDVALDPEDIAADIVIMAAGRTLPVGTQAPFQREDLARENAAVFRDYADALRRHGSGRELIVVVSNPVELGVAIFARELGRQRVFGMAAYLDSLRFRKEIARELRVSRRAVHGFMAGEHGDHLVPLWSTVDCFGLDREDRPTMLERLRRGSGSEDFVARIGEVKAKVSHLVQQGAVHDALRYLDTLSPDLRVAAKPFVVHYSGAKTAAATAEATVEFVATMHQGHDALVSGQILLEGEYGIFGPVGVPFVLSLRGVEEVVELPLEDGERTALSQAAAAIARSLAELADER